MKRYRVTVEGKAYEVEIDDPRARPVTARLMGEVFRVDVEAGGVQSQAGPDAAPQVTSTSGPGPGQLTAPIPGVIVKISSAPGQSVRQGDGLVTIEAMKMFNVIRSPWAGTVTTVHVAEGHPVAQGQPLVTLTLS